MRNILTVLTIRNIIINSLILIDYQNLNSRKALIIYFKYYKNDVLNKIPFKNENKI